MVLKQILTEFIRMAALLPPAGRARVAPRKAELEGFLGDLRRESENLRTL
jgi:hypothetical protein